MNSLCSTCLFKSPNTEDYVSLRKKVNIKGHEELELFKMLYECANVDCKETNGVAYQVCKECMNKICYLYDFRQTCLESQRTLCNDIKTNFEVIHLIPDVKLECDDSVEEPIYNPVHLKEEECSDVVNSSFEQEEIKNQDNDCLADYDIHYADNDDDDSSQFDHDDDGYTEPKKIKNLVTLSKSSDNKKCDLPEQSEDDESKSDFSCDLCGKSFMKIDYLRVRSMKNY